MQYKIVGGSMQVLDISLNENEKIYSDSGKLVSKSDNVIMTPRLVGGIFSAISRKVTGSTGQLTEFKAKDGIGNVSLAGVMPGKIKEIELEGDTAFVADDYSFLAAEENIKFTIKTVSLGAAFFGGTGLLMQELKGPGTVFIHVVGDIVEYELDGTRSLEVDPGHIAGFDSTLNYSIKFVDNIRTAMFGGLGLFLAKFTGKGKIILHSVSRYKLASELYLQALKNTKQGKK